MNIDANNENNTTSNSLDTAYELYHKLSTVPEQVCKRALSIEPVLLA